MQSPLFLNMQEQGTRAVTEHNYEEKQSERQSGAVGKVTRRRQKKFMWLL